MTVYRTICIKAFYTDEFKNKLCECIALSGISDKREKIFDNMMRLNKSVSMDKFLSDCVYAVYGGGFSYISIIAPEYVITEQFAQMISRELSALCVYSFYFDDKFYKMSLYKTGDKTAGFSVDDDNCDIYDADALYENTGIDLCGLLQTKSSAAEYLRQTEESLNALLRLDYNTEFIAALLDMLEKRGCRAERFHI